MPPLEICDLTDTAILWAFAGTNREGDPLVSPPVAIPVRWEEAQDEIADKEGTRWKVDVQLATNQDIPLGSILWYGPLSAASPPPTFDLYECVYRIHAKDLKGRVERYEFALKRYKDTLPKIV
jgi:hypothetical protein